MDHRTTDYTGWVEWRPTDAQLAEFFGNSKVPPEGIELVENQYFIVAPQEESDKKAIYKYQNKKLHLINSAPIKVKGDVKGESKVITPRNTEQRCAFDLISDESITCKVITGSWGTGKTMLLVTAALQALKEGKFKRIVWVRNNVRVEDTPDLGAVPGDINEKLMAFLGPFIDHVGNKKEVMRMLEDERLVVEPLQSLRGRDIEDSIIICSEAENLTYKHIKLLIARVAEGSNIWFDGDTRQRDKIVFKKSKGMEKMIRKLKGNELFGYVHLMKSERSKTARLADILDEDDDEDEE